MLMRLQTIWVPLGVASVVVAALLLTGGRRRHHAARLDAAWASGETGAALHPDQARGARMHPDIGGVIRRAVDQVRETAAAQQTVLEIAVADDLAMGADPLVVARALGEMIRQAVRRSPGGRVLVGATPRGGRIRIIVADDGDASDAALRRADLREPESLIALQGGSVELSCRPGEGAIVTLHLPGAAVAPSRTDRAAVTASGPASATEPSTEPAISR